MAAYDQDDKPVFQQASMEGHAVRAGILATGIAKAAAVNTRSDYFATAERWWQNMVTGKMYVTGGLGAIPSIEGFGADFDLPNNGYAETCATVAGGFFSRNMNLATGQAKYMDVLKRELYNGALSGVSLSGDRYFYTNKLSAGPDNLRIPWHGIPGSTPCCPPMLLKLMGALPGYFYATDADGVYVNLYGGSQVKIATKTLHLTLQQTTNYPWEGDVTLAVTPRKQARFRISLRVPGWSQDATVAVNGHSINPPLMVNGYLRLTRIWKKGDTIALHLPMPVVRLKADPRVAADVRRVALMRGPIVYCLEGLDNGGPTSALVIPPAAKITSNYRPDLLGGVTILQGDAKITRRQDPAAEDVEIDPVSFTAIPFSNRAPTDMNVWIADDPTHAQPVTLAQTATPSASHCNPSDTLFAMNDSITPKSSDDDSIPRMTWWDHRGTAEWAQYDFQAPHRLSGADVYWWDERRVGRECRVPQSWSIQYRENGQWKPVTGTSSFGTDMDVFNHVTFKPIVTTALRLAVQLQPGWSGGILQWRIQEAEH